MSDGLSWEVMDRPVSQMDGAGPECNVLSTPRGLPFKIPAAWNFAFIVTNANSFFFSLSLTLLSAAPPRTRGKKQL